jgi:hypothetical protein
MFIANIFLLSGGYSTAEIPLDPKAKSPRPIGS